MRKTGDTIIIKGTPLVLGEPLGGGGEGTVFDINIKGTHAAAKLIDVSKKSQKEIALIKRQIQELIDIRAKSKIKSKDAGTPSLGSFMCLPQALIENDVGYIMSKVENCEYLNNFLVIPETGQAEWLKQYDLLRRYNVITYLFERLEMIHIEGLVFSDLSPNNIMVSKKKDNTITFIDTDNLRTKSRPFSNVLGTPGFIAPEIFKNTNKTDYLTVDEKNKIEQTKLLTEQTDIFSASVIAFELLTLNHPFKGIKAVGDDTTPEDEMAAERGEMDYVLKPGTDNYCENNIFIDRFNDITTPEIRELFFRTFVLGKDSPLLRPTAEEFKEAFQRARRLIVRCPKCGEEMIYNIEKDSRNTLHSVTKCINPECEQKIDGQFLFNVYVDCGNLTADEAILGGNHSNGISAPMMLSSILLTPGTTEKIYLSDLGKSGIVTSDNRFCRIALDNGKVIFQLEKVIDGTSIYVESNQNKKPILVTGSTMFPYDHDHICFEKMKTKYGELKLIGKVEQV